MLKRRIVGVLIVKDNIVVQSIGFSRYLPVGNPEIVAEYLNQWGADEIILLDITATRNGRPPNFDLITKVAKHCRVPLTVGGGITTIEHIHKLMHCGADKVSFNHLALQNPQFLQHASSIFGTQSVVASIDACIFEGSYRVYDYSKDKILNVSPSDLASRLQTFGVGEIFLNSVDRDGKKSGFDIPLINHTNAQLSIPLIVSGGAGSPDHFVEVLSKTSASAVAAANIFHYFEHSLTIVKSQLMKYGHLIRFDEANLYEDSECDNLGRLMKKPDKCLESLLFQRIEEEKI